jgi:opacity protein-like surface antigen
MFFRQIVKVSLAAVLITSAFPAFSQVSPSGERKGLWFVVGAGVSNYDSDFSGRLTGPAGWVDWNLDFGPSFLSGLGLEAEARDLDYDRTGNVPNLGENSYGGGVLYTWRHFRNFHPYGKFLVEHGSVDFTLIGYPNYTHDTRTFYAPGGGVEYRAWRNVWVRGDYEYQLWPNFPTSVQTMKPQGFTIGVSYDLKHIHSY